MASTLTYSAPTKQNLIWQALAETRQFSEAIVKPLHPEDLTVQTDFVVSPLKWHLGHTAWLFERFVLSDFLQGYQVFDPEFEAVFNSYYNSVGSPFNKALRGNLSRPTVAQVMAYRNYVDEGLRRLHESGVSDQALALIELAIQHEKQHQELMLYDVKHILCSNLIGVNYNDPILDTSNHEAAKLQWRSFQGGLVKIGHQSAGFAYDNEGLAHQVFLNPYHLANRCVTNQEYLAFVEAQQYSKPDSWLADGWATVQKEGWQHPLYWRLSDNNWEEYGYDGWQPLKVESPVCHLSFFEADAYARWSGFRLPTEHEWESAFQTPKVSPTNHAYGGTWKPEIQISNGKDLIGAFDGVWEWTQSAYLPYPGYTFSNNGLGEYNGKFMSGQMVLRGGSCLSPPQHLRPTYRNFFHPASRWQMSGIRLAR